MRNAVQLIVDYGFEKFLVVVLFVFIFLARRLLPLR